MSSLYGKHKARICLRTRLSIYVYAFGCGIIVFHGILTRSLIDEHAIRFSYDRYSFLTS